MTACASWTVASEALFGSVARGDADRASDRDYLIVDDDVQLLRQREAVLRREGWSVAPYTFKKLQALSDAGALFVQHLKLEASVVVDADRRLSGLLALFRPKVCYGSDLLSNAKLARIIATRPDSAQGALWSADVLYVAVRNFGVLSLAQDGRYVFSYPDVVQGLIDRGTLRIQAQSALLKLRLLKALYRSGERFTSTQIESAVDEALSELPRRAFPDASISIEPARLLRNARLRPGQRAAYYDLRFVEKCFLAAQAVSPEIADTDFGTELSKWIENPRVYAMLNSRHQIATLGALKRCLRDWNRRVGSAGDSCLVGHSAAGR